MTAPATEQIAYYTSILHRHAQRYLNKYLQPHGISHSEHPFLLYISHHENPNQKQISEYLSVDEALTTRVLRKLEEKGIVQRQRDPLDHRAYYIQLTDQGWALQPVIDEALRAWSQCLTATMPEAEQEQLMAALAQMAGQAQQVNQHD